MEALRSDGRIYPNIKELYTEMEIMNEHFYFGVDIINILIILILSQFDPYLSRMPTYTPSLLHVKN